MISDPLFYLVAVPAVLLVGMAKSGFLSGFGSLATPLMALTVPVPQAAAVMLPLLVVMDVVTVHQWWRERDDRLLRLLIPAALVGTAIGFLLFGRMQPKTVAAVVGALTLVFLLQRLALALGKRRVDRLERIAAERGAQAPSESAAPPTLQGIQATIQPANTSIKEHSTLWGWLCGSAGGFTSFVVHAGGPPIAAYLLPMKLSPARFTGTCAVLFAAINASKWGPYAWLGLIDWRNMSTALVLLPLAPVGVWVGSWLTRRVRPDAFYAIAYVGMAATGLKLLWDGIA